ncbi:hypothetical protein ACJJTC_000078 [Scirpophaga incertulas]
MPGYIRRGGRKGARSIRSFLPLTLWKRFYSACRVWRSEHVWATSKAPTPLPATISILPWLSPLPQPVLRWHQDVRAVLHWQMLHQRRCRLKPLRQRKVPQKQLPSTSGGTPLGTNTETPGPNTTGEQHLTTSALLASTTHTEQTISISLLPENPATPPSARRPQRRTTPQSSSSPSCSSSLWERSPQTWTHSVRKSNK